MQNNGHSFLTVRKNCVPLKLSRDQCETTLPSTKVLHKKQKSPTEHYSVKTVSFQYQAVQHIGKK